MAKGITTTNGTAPGEFMHESLHRDAVLYDMDSDEVIQALCEDNQALQNRCVELERQLTIANHQLSNTR